MFEIIWSTWQDKFVIRRISPIGNVRAVFIGTKAACIKAINNFNPH